MVMLMSWVILVGVIMSWLLSCYAGQWLLTCRGQYLGWDGGSEVQCKNEILVGNAGISEVNACSVLYLFMAYTWV